MSRSVLALRSARRHFSAVERYAVVLGAVQAARVVTAFGAVYLALAIGGALSAPGLEVLHLGTADHVFHAGVGAASLVVAAGAHCCEPQRPSTRTVP